MDIALSCFKYLLFLFNLVIALLGIAITAVAIWLVVDPSYLELNTNIDVPVLNSVAYVAIVVGLVMLFVGFLGCCGAFQTNKCMLLTYVIVVTILLIVQIVIAALVLKAVNDSEIQGKVNSFLKKQITDGKRRNDRKSDFMDFIETKLECCGINGPDDYKDQHIPRSCFNDDNDYYQTGCSEKIKDLIKNNSIKIGGILLAAFFIQFIAGVMALCLYCSAKHGKSDVV